MDHKREVTQAEKSFDIAIPEQPVTEERKPFKPSKSEALADLGTPRANIAADTKHPNGTVEGGFAARNKHRTVVQQHCDYFDPDGDGVIWPSDTYHGCRRFGESAPSEHDCTSHSGVEFNGRMEYISQYLGDIHHQLQSVVSNRARHPT